MGGDDRHWLRWCGEWNGGRLPSLECRSPLASILVLAAASSSSLSTLSNTRATAEYRLLLLRPKNPSHSRDLVIEKADPNWSVSR